MFFNQVWKANHYASFLGAGSSLQLKLKSLTSESDILALGYWRWLNLVLGLKYGDTTSAELAAELLRNG